MKKLGGKYPIYMNTPINVHVEWYSQIHVHLHNNTQSVFVNV